MINNDFFDNVDVDDIILNDSLISEDSIIETYKSNEALKNCSDSTKKKLSACLDNLCTNYDFLFSGIYKESKPKENIYYIFVYYNIKHELNCRQLYMYFRCLISYFKRLNYMELFDINLFIRFNSPEKRNTYTFLINNSINEDSSKKKNVLWTISKL